MVKYKLIQSEQVSKERYCFRNCLEKQRTVCIINVWGYTEILPRVPVPKKIPDLVAGSNIKKSTAGNKQCESLLDVCRTLFLCNVK